jgi:hypothetical protein
LVVGELLCEVFYLVDTSLGLALPIAQLFGLRTELAPQAALCLIHMLVGIGLVHSERFERMARTASRDSAGLLDCTFQLTAQLGW